MSYRYHSLSEEKALMSHAVMISQKHYLCLLLLGSYTSSFSPEWSSVTISSGTDLQVVLEKFSLKKPVLTEDLKWSCLFHLGCFWTKACGSLEERTKPVEMQPRKCSTEEYEHRSMLNKQTNKQDIRPFLLSPDLIDENWTVGTLGKGTICRSWGSGLRNKVNKDSKTCRVNTRLDHISTGFRWLHSLKTVLLVKLHHRH